MKYLLLLLILALATSRSSAQTSVVHDYLWIQFNALNGQLMIIGSDTTQSKLVQVERERRKGMTVRMTTRMANALFTAVQEYEAKGWELLNVEPAMSVMVMRRVKE